MVDLKMEIDPYLWYCLRIKGMVKIKAIKGKIRVAYLIGIR